MRKLLKEVERVPESVKKKVTLRLKQFSSIKKDTEWFSELCFCILTANAKSITGCAVQKELGYEGFSSFSFEEIRDAIKRNKHRFHNVKASRIIEARKHLKIKNFIVKKVKNEGTVGAREWLVENIKGYGYKEASHFLRNVGYFDLAILDRHIVNLMMEFGLLDEVPKSWNRARYLAAEKSFQQLASKAVMSCGELDLYMWYLKAGDVLK